MSGWLIPLVLSIAAFGFAAYLDKDNNSRSGDYGAGGIVSLIRYGLALIVVLIVWLIWSFIR